jgi:formylglycine-generating enzyme required for sulfatase activity
VPAASVFGILRSPEQDVVLLANRDRLSVDLDLSEIVVRTPFGLLRLPAERCAGLRVIERGVTSEPGLVYSGLWEAETVMVRPQAVPVDWQVPVAAIETVVFREHAGTPSLSPAEGVPFVARLEGGDVWAGWLSSTAIAVLGLQGEGVSVDLSQALELRRVDAGRFAVVLSSGDEFELAPGGAELRLRLVDGPVVDALPVRAVEHLIVGSLESERLVRAGTHTNSLGMRLRPIPPGQFSMGAALGNPDERPVRHVTITEPFFMGSHEVTQEQYKSLMGEPDTVFEGDDLPAVGITWDDALEFCRRLSEREGRTYRLPTEAEWEYACRAGGRTAYPWGDEVAAHFLWWDGNGRGGPQPVGRLAANPWGLYDVSGNVWEWCMDWYAAAYDPEDTRDPLGPLTGGQRVLRGGGWTSPARDCTCSRRGSAHPRLAGVDGTAVGFRVVLIP